MVYHAECENKMINIPQILCGNAYLYWDYSDLDSFSVLFYKIPETRYFVGGVSVVRLKIVCIHTKKRKPLVHKVEQQLPQEYGENEEKLNKIEH